MNVNGNGAWMNPTVSLSANDAVVAMAIARRANNNPNLYLAVYDQSFTYLTNSDTSQPLGHAAAIGEWIFVMAICRVSASSNGNLQARWVTTGTGDIDMSETYFYKVSTPANNSTAAYFFLPNP